MSERLLLEVRKGHLVPADGYTVEALRERGYAVGDVLSADLKKPRNIGFHRLAHAFGKIVSDNLDAFHGMSAHEVLKRLQLESGAECETVRINLDGQMVDYRVAKSLSFANLDQAAFESVYRSLCRYVSRTYWPECNEDQIAEMASAMVDQ